MFLGGQKLRPYIPMAKARGVTGAVDKGAKSKFVSCKKCGSKIATGYLHSNYCPVCREDLRPKSLLDSIKSMHDRRDELDKKIREATIKASKKAPLYWLVKIEYHT